MKDKLKAKSKEKQQTENTKDEKSSSELTDKQVEKVAAGITPPDGYNVDANGEWFK